MPFFAIYAWHVRERECWQTGTIGRKVHPEFEVVAAGHGVPSR